MKTALVKLALMLAGDGKAKRKVWTAVLSIIAGFLALMFLPVAVLHSIGNTGNDAMSRADFNISPDDVIARLSTEQQDQLYSLERINREIEAAMSDAGVRIQTRKAQIIYISSLTSVSGFNAEPYAHLFAMAPNDRDLITAINSTYGVSLDYEDFLKTYTGLMNLTINPYMFDDESTKNCADLAHWADNTYISGWGYKAGYTGNQCEEDHIRYADNAGLMLGYLNYDPTAKEFGENYTTLTYTVQGDISTMPDIPGIGLYDGSKHGVYIGGGEVVFSSAIPGYVTRQTVAEGTWSLWCTYEGISYPQEVDDAIEAIRNSPDDSSNENNNESEVESNAQ